VSRFRKALAAATMAIAAAGGGLLITAASAVPASASARPAPHGGHTITVTAHPRTHAASRIGPHDILPCTVKPGAGIKPASCGDQVIYCVITANRPEPNTLPGAIVALSTVRCDHPVTQISLTGTLFLNGAPVTSFPGVMQGQTQASAQGGIPCQPGTYTNSASATITLPPGFVITGGKNPIHAASSPFTTTCNNGGGGGGGGCAVHSLFLAGHPAGRRPSAISCP
jgi:hypothetical protein